MERKAARVWATASRCHLNLEYTFRFNSQPLAVRSRSTSQLAVEFGLTWFSKTRDLTTRSQRGETARWDCCVTGGTPIASNRARQGSRFARQRLFLPVLDLRALTDDQLIMAELIFEEFRDKELKPAYLADADPNRALLDRRVVCDLLGFDEETYVGVRRLAAKWCAEPSVHGGKSRPRGSGLVL